MLLQLRRGRVCIHCHRRKYSGHSSFYYQDLSLSVLCGYDLYSFMGFLAVNFFIGLAEGTKILLNGFYKPEGQALLLFSGTTANRTFKTLLSHFSVFFSYLG